jgi:1-acyl-sn-glycerol-3-phosphate acyltransferase
VRILFSTLSTNVFLVLGSVACGLGAIVASLVRPRSNLAYRCAVAWGRGLLRSAGARLEVTHDGGLAPSSRYVFMANHQSLFDIPALLASLPVETRFLAKKSLFALPVFGQALRVSGFVPVDREDRTKAVESFGAALRQLQSGRSILLFPEETRSVDGRVLPFRPGGFLIALKARVAVVPVGVSGTRDVRRKGSLWSRPGTVRVHYGRPIGLSDAGVRQRRALMEQVRAEIVALSGCPAVEEVP